LLVLLLVVLFVLFQWFYPWLSPLMPFSNNTVNNGGPGE
jgi:hypothetical protein